MCDKDKKFLNNKINLIYKMLPMYEEKKDWTVLCSTLIVDLYGWQSEKNIDATDIIYKLKGILELYKQEAKENDSNNDFFPIFRRTIFSCINILKELMKQ